MPWWGIVLITVGGSFVGSLVLFPLWLHLFSWVLFGGPIRGR